MKPTFLYMTAGNKAEAARIGKALVESRLAACVNIIENMSSIYLWEGDIQDDSETVMIAKTVESHVPAVVEKVTSLHSYDCPCVVSLPVTGGHQDFLEWIAESVR